MFRLFASFAAAATILAAMCVSLPASAAAPKGEAVWDLSELYPNIAAWDRERAALEKEVAGIGRFKGTLGREAKSMLAAFDAISAIDKRLSRLAIYASLKSDEDVRSAGDQARNQAGGTLYSKLGEATAWVKPEILSIGSTKVESFIAGEPRLKKNAFFLRDVLRGASHTLGGEAEDVLAKSANALGQPGNVYTILANGELPFPSVTLSDGRTVKLDQAAYTLYRQAPHRADRKKVFDAFWATFKSYEGTFGANLQAAMMGNVFNAKARKFNSALEASLFADNMPEPVVRTLISEVNRALPTFHRYLKLRARMLKVKDLAYYDVYAPLTSVKNTYTLDDSKRLTLAALAPFGSEYTDILKDAFGRRWMHVYPQKGKKSGAYMSGGAYDVHPYVLLNHNDDYESLSVFAHEWGHAVHTVLTTRAQPYELSNYATFTAETASITNEVLLFEYMLARAKSKDEKLAFLNEALDEMRGSYFRQTMFAEFLVSTHTLAEKGEPLTGERMTQLYCDLLRRYHGEAKGVMKVDPAYCVEWAFIPHFYGGFYVYNYATSMAGGAYLADEMVKKGDAARKRFIALLSAGGSDYAYNLYKTAGIDMATPVPYRALEARMNAIMDQMEKLLAEK
jgi:oligoendopeptidase F